MLRKRVKGEKENHAWGWRGADQVELPDGNGGTGTATVNRYFLEKEDMILGEQGLYDTLTQSARIGVRPRPGADLATDLREAVKRLPENVMSDPSGAQQAGIPEAGSADLDAPETKAGGYYIKDGDLYQFDGTKGEKVARRSRENTKGLPKAAYERVTALVPVKMALRDVYARDVNGEDASAERAALNKAYDAFVKKFGPINKVERSERRPSIVELETARQQAYEDARASDGDFDVGSFDPSGLFQEGASLRDIAAARREAMGEKGYREGSFNPDDVPSKIVAKHPNIDPFGDDQESFRLRAIEHFNPETGEATKGLVFSQSAVSVSKAPKINSPEDALLYVLGEDGRVDIGKIADLSKSDPDTVARELEGKIFRDPASGEWQTASKYLSGNVRKKLDAAQKAAVTEPSYKPNVAALEAVQPDPIPASEIRVPLGAHWFEPTVYGDFARSLGLKLKAEYRPALGVWTVEGSEKEAAAKNEYGTEDRPFATIMGLMMNNKSLQVKRTVKEADGSTRTFVDDTATQAAIDKAKELQDKWTEWLWSDQARSDGLQETYNAKFNSEVAPRYDGGYLTTPGVNSAWDWRPHQRAVIARILQDGNTYMAHTVGAGKTSAMIGAAMEARRLGLAKRPMFVVPNHMLNQFATEFYEQYPLANVAVADEKRFHTSRRKQFIADIALNDYDAVIITHSSFEKIPPSERSRAQAVETMIADIRELVDETADDRTGEAQAVQRSILGALGSMASIVGVDIKTVSDRQTSTRKKIEAILEAAEQRVERQLADTGKDSVFDFDEIGVDMLFVDEAHLFRKLSFATTNGNIKGIDPSGSKMSMDLFVKTRAVERRNPGRGIILASGTPITNTMAELYSVSRYLQPDALEARGVAAFDAWAQTFGTVEGALEQDPAGGYKEVARFARFVNAPELSLMVRQVMDVVSGADLEQYVTRPKLKGGKRNFVLVEATGEVKSYQQSLKARMERIQQRKKPPQKGDDILLSVINDGRLAAIDMRLVDPSATGHGSKLERLITNAYRNWEAGRDAPLHGVKPEGGYTDKPIATGPTTQIIFATLGVNPSKHNPDFAVHRFIRSELIRLGVPAGDIILAGDLKTHALKQRAFNDMNEGKKRILIGSKTLFTGVNAQRRISAIHNLDPLWYPADDEQRNGRGIRQGNMNPEIEINDYSTKGTYDATMWQMMGRKAAFIEAFFRGDPSMRDIEDLGEASQYEQAKALSTADPRVLELTDLRSKRDTLERRAMAVERQKSSIASRVRSAKRRIEHETEETKVWADIAGKVQDTSGDKFTMTVGGVSIDSRKEAGSALIEAADKLLETATEAQSNLRNRPVGKISGFDVLATASAEWRSVDFTLQFAGSARKEIGFSIDPVGLVRRFESGLQTATGIADELRRSIKKAEAEIVDLEASRGKVKPFGEQAELDALNAKILEIETALLTEAKKDTEAGKAQAPDGWEFAETVEIKPMTPSEAREVGALMTKELSAHGLSGKVQASVVSESLKLRGREVNALYRTGMIQIGPLSDNRRGTMHHEVVHALRDAKLWGRPYGLFSKAEWQGLVRYARAQEDIVSSVEGRYSDQTTAVKTEEAVAEAYRLWRQGADARGPVQRALEKIKAVLEAMANALRGRGFQSASRTFELMASGRVGKRGAPEGQGSDRAMASRFRDSDGKFIPPGRKVVQQRRSKKPGFAPVGEDHWIKRPGGFASNILTDAMGAADAVNLLALVPGRALFAELGKRLASAGEYLRLKEGMDALRNDWQSKTDVTARAWLKLIRKDTDANGRMMDLMHRATLAGIDPSKPYEPNPALEQAKIEASRPEPSAMRDWAEDLIAQDRAARRSYGKLGEEFDALPEEFKAMFRTVRDRYDEMGDAFEKAVVENIDTAMEIALKRARRAYEKRMREIDDEGLKGAPRDEAVAAAEKSLALAKARNGWSKKARIAQLRAQFERNRLEGPYFPLARFGKYFVTLRNSEGKVVSFSRFRTAREQKRFAKEKEREDGISVATGVIGDQNSLEGHVDAGFVAEIQEMLGEYGADKGLMDAVWQRWLETLPDQSIRTSQIHRKGRAGYNADAYRAFAHHLFHGAHQLARLRFSLKMQDALDEARLEAATSEDPNRAGLVVDEMQRRHQFTMNPAGGQAATTATSLAFIWYLGVSPAAAIVNLSQTTVMGVPIMRAGFAKSNIAQVTTELAKAAGDFANREFSVMGSKRLTTDERAAIKAAYKRGTVDKTQAHDLASVAESGVEYSGQRERVMRWISFFFHQAEVMNREVTFLAAYRLARKEGDDHYTAIDRAAAMTWKVHFDYQNTSRPRFMQGDVAKVLFVFRQFSVNMIWRMWRDAHQTFHGKTKAERLEARRQLVGVTLSMMAHAGITGTWGYGLITWLLGAFFEGGDDEVDEWLQDSLLLSGDSTGVAAWNYAMGMALKGVPGHTLGINLSERIGMPDLWFRGANRDMDARESWQHLVGEVLGPVAGIGESWFRGAGYMADGHWWRGTEAFLPKFMRDVLKAARYGAHGVETLRGDPILEDVSVYQAAVQAAGFTPASVAERYGANSRMKNRERRIMDERKGIHKEITDALRAGRPIPERAMDKLYDFNAKYPEYPITNDTIRRSLQGRLRASARNEFGVQLNPRLNERIRDEAGALLYN